MFIDVVGFEEYLEVNASGEVRSKDRYVLNNGTPVLRKGKTLAWRNNGSGYFQIAITINGVRHQWYVHRLVAQHFIPNPDNLPEVNHKDGDKSKNEATNLVWCTRKDNYHHAVQNNLIKRDKSGQFI